MCPEEALENGNDKNNLNVQVYNVMNIMFQGVLKNQVGTVNGGHLSVEYAPHLAVGGGWKDRSYQGGKE